MPERLFFQEYFSKSINTVCIEKEDWKNSLTKKLSNDGFATVSCPIETRHRLQEVLNYITVEPIETGYLKAYARLVGIKRNDRFEEIECELVEALQ